MIMMVINIVLVLLGVTIPLATAIFWSRTAKILKNQPVVKSHESVILNGNNDHKFIKWFYSHRSKFNVFVAVIVTIIEFLALIPL